MEGLQVFLMVFLVVGFAAGAGAVWLVLQGRTSTAYDRARSELQSTLTELSEQLQGKEEQAQALQSALDQGVSATGALKAEVEEVTARQTAAESEKAALAGSLQERDQRLAALESELAGAQSELAGAQAELALRAEQVTPPPPPLAAPASDESVLQVLARPIEEHLAELRVRLEQLSAAPCPEPELSEEILRNLARPIEERISDLRQRFEEIGAVRPEPVVSEEVLQSLVRPIGEQLSDMRMRLEQLCAAPVTAEILQNLARPIEGRLHAVERQLERMESDQARYSAATAGLQSRNVQLHERLHNVSSGLCELRGALARSLDLCSLAVATTETVVEAPTVEAPTVEAEAVLPPPPAVEAEVAPEPQPVAVAECSEPVEALAVIA